MKKKKKKKAKFLKKLAPPRPHLRPSADKRGKSIGRRRRIGYGRM